MKKKLRILYLSTEIAPFNAETPLSEMSFNLTRFYRTQGHDIRVVMPRYNFIRDRKYNLREVIRLKEIPVPLSGRLEMASVKSGFIPDTKVQVYFLENEKYFSRDGVYDDPETGKLYPDSDERFIVFTRAVVEMLKILSWQPQVIHVSDWTSALTAFYVNSMYAGDEFYQPSKIILSITDYKKSGTFPDSTVFKAGLNPLDFKPGCDAELNGKFSFLKAGAIHADKIVINGENTIKEFDKDFRTWFEKFLTTRKNDLSCIPFGLDSKFWNPDKDEKITANFSHKDLSGKIENKKMLIDKYSLDIDPETPMIGCVWDGGDFEPLKEVLELAKERKLGLVIADKTAGEDAMNDLAASAPGQIGAICLLTNLTIKQLLSGSDFLILASEKYKDLLHYKAAKYGSMPIAPNTGYFVDDLGDAEDKLPGLIYKKNNAKSLKEAMVKAIKMYEDTRGWAATTKKAMKYDSGWNKIAHSYLEIYDEIT